MFTNKPEIIIDSQLHLRPFKKSDAQRMFEIITMPQVIYFTGSAESWDEINNPDCSDEAFLRVEQWYGELVARTDRLDLAIEYNGIIVGELVINEYNENTNEANFRVLIDDSYTSQGIGFRSIEAFLQHVFRHTSLERIILDVFDYNPRGKHVYENLGFIFDYQEKDTITIDDVSYNSDFYHLDRN